MNFAEQLRADLKKVVEANNLFDLVERAEYKDGGDLLHVEIHLPESRLAESFESVISSYLSDPLRRIRTPLDFTDAVDHMVYGHSAYKTYALGEWIGARTEKKVAKPKQVIFSGPKTIVLWPDGTKTIVSLSEGEEYDEYTAFCAAFVKKVFGGTHRAKKFLESIKSCPEPKAKKKKSEEQEQVEEYSDNYETDKGPCEGERC